MEYRLNLSGHFKKSKLRLCVGILFILFPLVLIVYRIWTGQQVRIWDWTGAAILSINGLYHITGGMGYLLENFLGRKSFVHIDEEQIRIKTISKARQAYWNEMKSISHQNGYIRITKKDEMTELVMVSMIDTSYFSSLLAVLREAAAKKNIEFIG